MLKDYDGLDIDKAIDKLKSKIRWDAEDIAFANARAEYLSPEELEIINGGEQVARETGKGSNEMSLDTETPTSGPTDGTETVNQVEVVQDGEVKVEVSMKMTLDTLQAKAAELDLDTSGTKQELVNRITAKLSEPKA